MSEPRNATCEPWATVADVCSPCDDYDFDAGLLDDSLQAASDVLFKLTGHRWPGICTTTVRPLRAGFAPLYDPSYDDLARRAQRGLAAARSSFGIWRPYRRAADHVGLGVFPVTAITSVTVDGAVVDPATYRVDDWRWLVRTDGQTWPTCPDVVEDPDAFSVTVQYGRTPPQLGVMAAAELGCQLALACQPETVGDCRLPKRVTSITRQGVSMVVLDPFEFLDAGKTGLYTVDLFIRAYNPNGLQRRAAVLTPSSRQRVRRTDT